MIELSNIYKSYGSLNVLQGVSLSVGRGEIVAIVGPSGAGKTTLLQIAGSLDRPDSGSVIYDGVDITTLKEKRLAEFRNRNIGFIFQFHELLPEFTALENVAIPGLIGGVDAGRLQKKPVTCSTFLDSATVWGIVRRNCRAAKNSVWP